MKLLTTLEATANAEKFMKVVRKYTSFEELTPTLLREFVEKIVIHESEALDGKRRGEAPQTGNTANSQGLIDKRQYIW